MLTTAVYCEAGLLVEADIDIRDTVVDGVVSLPTAKVNFGFSSNLRTCYQPQRAVSSHFLLRGPDLSTARQLFSISRDLQGQDAEQLPVLDNAAGIG